VEDPRANAPDRADVRSDRASVPPALDLWKHSPGRSWSTSRDPFHHGWVGAEHHRIHPSRQQWKEPAERDLRPAQLMGVGVEGDSYLLVPRHYESIAGIEIYRRSRD
jgi:hypothetical protein